MKKAIIIFSLGLSLIIGGSFVTLSELKTWNTSEITFEDEGYEVKSIFINVNIEKYNESSITDNIAFANPIGYNLVTEYTELDSHYKIDKSQPVGTLKFEVIYYPRFGECKLRANEFNVENNRINFDNRHHRPHGRRTNNKNLSDNKLYLDLSSDCYKGYLNEGFFNNHIVDLENVRTIMRLKKFPFNIQQVIITTNPNDEYKLIK